MISSLKAAKAIVGHAVRRSADVLPTLLLLPAAAVSCWIACARCVWGRGECQQRSAVFGRCLAANLASRGTMYVARVRLNRSIVTSQQWLPGSGIRHA